MKISPTAIADVVLVEPRVFGDARGYFYEVWNEATFRELVPGSGAFVQDNHSMSRRGTLRGLHYQIEQAQGKLVRCTRGSVFDVAVDLRRSSATFGKWVGEVLSEENRRQLWIPPGFAHGFLVLSDEAEFQYKCTEFYAPEHERTLAWNSAEVGVDWPLPEGAELLLSDKDSAATDLADCDTYR